MGLADATIHIRVGTVMWRANEPMVKVLWYRSTKEESAKFKKYKLPTGSLSTTFAAAPSRTHLHHNTHFLKTLSSLTLCEIAPTLCPNWLLFTPASSFHLMVSSFFDDSSALVSSSFASSPSYFFPCFCLKFFSQLLPLVVYLCLRKAAPPYVFLCVFQFFLDGSVE